MITIQEDITIENVYAFNIGALQYKANTTVH